MDRSLELQKELESIADNVYYQPPASLYMKYPCIRYSKKSVDVKRANNRPYAITDRYEGFIIDYDCDSTIPMEVLQHFEMCSLGTMYVADNLYHWPITIYY